MSNVAFLWIFSRGMELGVIVLCLLPLRVLLRKKVPRLFSYLLWGALPVNIVYNLVLRIMALINHRVIDHVYKNPKIVVDEKTVQCMKWCWVCGTVVVISVMVYSYVYLLRILVGSIRMQKGVYITDRIVSPFTLGLLHPKIYLPLSLKRECYESVILHERVHITRRDVWAKYLAVVVLGLFWFQPILWFAYRLFVNDMEEACDETVIRKKGAEFREEYARSLLEVSFQAGKIGGAALGYRGGEIKARIVNVMNYKKAGKKTRIIALILCCTFMIIAIPLSWQVPRMVKPNEVKKSEIEMSTSGRGIKKQDITDEKEWNMLGDYDEED